MRLSCSLVAVKHRSVPDMRMAINEALDASVRAVYGENLLTWRAVVFVRL
jgi:hypothetical protein